MRHRTDTRRPVIVTRRLWKLGTIALAMGVAIACAAAPLPVPAPRVQHTAAAPRPNIVVIMTDDQDSASLRYMPSVRKLLADKGTTFDNSFVSYSLCCPSRATFLTGQYPHNHGVMDNNWPNGGYRRLSRNTLPVWLRRSGYATAHVGKFLNQYGSQKPREIPPGWQTWYGTVGASAYRMWGYTINENGKLKKYGKPGVQNPKLYQTDVLARKAVNYIRNRKGGAPFFLSFAPLASHTEPPVKGKGPWFGPRPAPRHRGDFGRTALPRPPSFNEADMSDKPRQLRSLKRLSKKRIKEITRDYRMRLESLQAVDQAVAKIVNAVKARGALNRTLYVFTSDNGYLMGQHRFASNKIHPYEESIRVPLIVRGPGFPSGRHARSPVSNVDLAATVLAAAGARSGVRADGRPLQRSTGSARSRDLLIETGPKPFGGAWYAAIRTGRYLYVEHSNGERELYDLITDPYQLNSRHGDPMLTGVRWDLSRRLQKLRHCAGSSCS